MLKAKIEKEIGLIKSLLETVDLNEDTALTINTIGSVKGLLDNIMYKLVDEQTKKCEHPESYRLDLSTMGRPVEWECRLCGHHYTDGQEGENP